MNVPVSSVSDDDAAGPLRERGGVVRVDAVVDRLQREQRDRDLGERPSERSAHAEDDPARLHQRDLAHEPPAAPPDVRGRVTVDVCVAAGRCASAGCRSGRGVGLDRTRHGAKATQLRGVHSPGPGVGGRVATLDEANAT